MKILIALSFLYSSLVFAQAPGSRLMCQFDGPYFRVTDGVQRWEKYIGITSNPQVECGRDFGFGVAGPYILTFWKGQINDKYVGTYDTKGFLVRGHLALVFKGPYLIVAKAGSALMEKYIGGTSTPVIEASSSLALISYGSYLYVTDGRSIQEKYVGNVTAPVLSVGRNIGGALLGSYLLVSTEAGMKDFYIGNRTAQDNIIAGRKASLIAASAGAYFIVYDVSRGTKQDTYIGQSGKVEVREDGAYHFSGNRITRYNLLTGSFESL